MAPPPSAAISVRLSFCCALLPGFAEMEERQFDVLVVEDDLAINRLVTMVLLRHGYHVEHAQDGVEAVLKLGLVEFDVIILDLMMPNLDGFTFINTFAESDPSVLRKVIVTSAASPVVIRERLKAAPFMLLPKPFDLHELVEAVRRCVEAQ